MDSTAARHRILIIARPARGRELEAILRAADHEVYRAPGDSALPELLDRVRPHMAVIALDPTWLDGVAIAHLVTSGSRRLAVLLVGHPDRGASTNGFSWVSSDLGPDALRQAVAAQLPQN